ncbi:hypothetical protein GCM10009590_00920 [Brachybacterium alimentarium]
MLTAASVAGFGGSAGASTACGAPVACAAGSIGNPAPTSTDAVMSSAVRSAPSTGCTEGRDDGMGTL